MKVFKNVDQYSPKFCLGHFELLQPTFLRVALASETVTKRAADMRWEMIGALAPQR